MHYLLFIACFLLSSFSGVYGEYGERPLIISRNEWGADEDFTSRESSYWQNILEKRSQAVSQPVSAATLKYREEKNKKINTYLNENFSKYFTVDHTEYYNTNAGFSYAWPLKYTSFVDSIIVHHTEGEYEDSISGVRDIYKFHSISRQWGDIGYNYIIGYDGEIFEGKAGGDYVAGAHSKYNNYGSVGISLLGNYNNREVSNSQKESLESLVQYLTKKYGIDLSKKRYYHMNCSQEKCKTFPLETYLDSVIAGHRDTGHTSCPGENLYPLISEIRQNNLASTSGFTPILRGSSKSDSKEQQEYSTSQIFTYKKLLDTYDSDRLLALREAIQKAVDSKKYDVETTKKLKILRVAVFLKLKD